ncbi:MAG: hypothetical protein JXA94_06425, partial [Parachlamydiales bacterium]|nr:hypothetical protein [Parachlamydiales bacterium]
MLEIFSSNNIELLSGKIKENIFLKNPLSKSYIFIENTEYKNFLLQSFLEDEKIDVCFGLNFIKFSNFINFFKNELSFNESESFFLTQTDLQLLISKKIEKKLFLRDSDVFNNLRKYLIKDGIILKNRLFFLSETLAQNFLKRTIYIDIKNELEPWQQIIFDEIFINDDYFYPLK